MNWGSGAAFPTLLFSPVQDGRKPVHVTTSIVHSLPRRSTASSPQPARTYLAAASRGQAAPAAAGGGGGQRPRLQDSRGVRSDEAAGSQRAQRPQEAGVRELDAALGDRGSAKPQPIPFKHQGQSLEVFAFYYPGREDACDKKCRASFLGNFYDLGPGGLRLESKMRLPSTQSFRNAEAAFQALKFWDKAHEFKELSGEQAFQRKRQLAGREDRSLAGYSSNWEAMKAVLEAKFRRNSPMARRLLETGGAYLLEHSPVPGRDRLWSDNNLGDGLNWLGLQLMFLRQELGGERGKDEMLMKCISGWINKSDGKPKNPHGQAEWQKMVMAATQALRVALGSDASRQHYYSSPSPATRNFVQAADNGRFITTNQSHFSRRATSAGPCPPWR